MFGLLTCKRSRMTEAWKAHCEAEFEAQSIEDTMKTMDKPSYVLNIPTCVGGKGVAGITAFYSNDFVGKTPEDTKTTRLRLTVDPKSSTLVDEMLFEFTHAIEMPWMLPGVAPTGKKVSVPLVVSVGFSEDGRKVVSERIYWDQASVLQQIGKLELNQRVVKLPIVGKRQANTFLDPESLIGTHCSGK